MSSTAASAAPKAARQRTALPNYALYGEPKGPKLPGLHVESIDSRSRRFNWEIDAHVHQGLHQLVWVGTGQVDASLDEIRMQCHGPTALVIPNGVAHAFRFSRACEGFVMTFSAGVLTEGDSGAAAQALRDLFAEPRALALEHGAPDAKRLQTLLGALHDENHAADSAEGPVPTWLARAIVWRMAQALRSKGPAATTARVAGQHSIYTRWVVLLEAHYRDHWPVTRFASSLGLSAERLNRVLRNETGHNALALIQSRLLREASRRLVHVAVPVSKLAFELGFEDPAYFCRFFKRHSGLSPREFRSRALRP